MLKVYRTLFERLNQEIPCVVWKACHDMESALEGKGDIDLLVDLDYQGKFRQLLNDHGFVHAEFDTLKFPFVTHYYGFDEETGKICHLNVYYQLVTGETHLKSYHIPLEKEVINNRFLNSMKVYVCSYRDQALIYSLRHYMKRASLVGFLLWAYERKDYLAEYAYISNGLASLEGRNPLPAGDKLSSEFNFYNLDMGTGLSGYRKARKKISAIASFRRMNAWQAVWKSLYNLGVRLYYKLFRVKKRVDNGVLLAISGVDGSGKSSMVNELYKWFSRDLDVKVFHLGKPSPALLTYPLRPLLFVYRLLKGKNKANYDELTEDSGNNDAVKKKNGFVWAVRYGTLAYERCRLARIARDLAGKGKIIICDRYPTNSSGKMDSPRIGPGGSKLVEKIRSYEQRLYNRTPEADGLAFLNVSQEEAINRNRARIKKDKETDDEIAFRHRDNQGLDFRAHRVFLVDANRDYDSVLKNLKSIAWDCLIRGR